MSQSNEKCPCCGEYLGAYHTQEFCDEKVAKQESIRRMKSILKDHGIIMSVGGCGCCESPVVRFAYMGEEVVGSPYPDGSGFTVAENVNFDMFEDAAKSKSEEEKK